MDSLEESYRACYELASTSGSNFYRSFSLLTAHRRKGMQALYAFSRLVDDQADSPKGTGVEWNAKAWHRWISELRPASDEIVPLPHVARASRPDQPLGDAQSRVHIPILEPIRPALQDTVQRFHVPLSVLNQLVDGVDFDQQDSIRFEEWSDLVRYCELVASSVGCGCLAIWNPTPNVPLPEHATRAARACGVAFQITNILRDIVEDADRNRCYLAEHDLKRMGIEATDWKEFIQKLRSEPNGNEESRKALRRVIELYGERALGYYEAAWLLHPILPIDGKRMFSLMWHHYRALLQQIVASPLEVLNQRVHLSSIKKLTLAAQHFLTPLYLRFSRSTGVSPEVALRSRSRRPSHDENRLPQEKCSTDLPNLGEEIPLRDLRVAVVGGGLAGCNAALHLARHGCDVSLFEAKSKLGGRVGSFTDLTTGKSIDYCQHVGMKCCTSLQRWIEETGQQEAWTEEKQLRFVSNEGKKIIAESIPLPPPFHLSKLFWSWPGLRLWDRVQIGSAIWRMLRSRDEEGGLDSKLAVDWLREQKQSSQSIERFWKTILVSALGEKIERVSYAAMRKVLVDGFARRRDAYHLLVPTRPLAELADSIVRHRLVELECTIRDGTVVARVESTPGETPGPRSDHRSDLSENASQRFTKEGVRVRFKSSSDEMFHGAVVAVPWRKLPAMVDLEPKCRHLVEEIESSPITGVHTWWDRPWLDQPHAILIDRFAQWIFPGPSQSPLPQEAKSDETYYQFVISASEDLRTISSETILTRIEEEVRELFPKGARAKLLRGYVVTDSDAVISMTPEVRKGRLGARHLQEDRILLAGDWTDTGWPSTMEGALRSGETAAEALLNRLGHPTHVGRNSFR